MNARGQLVLVAATAIAVALVPVLVASLQFGAHPDVAASADVTHPHENAVRVLERAVDEAVADTERDPWTRRQRVVDAVRTRLRDPIATLEVSRVSAGVAYDVSYNESVPVERCPSGPNRQFGDCDAIDGVVVQERAGETHVLAVAFDVSVTGPDGTGRVTRVIAVR